MAFGWARIFSLLIKHIRGFILIINIQKTSPMNFSSYGQRYAIKREALWRLMVEAKFGSLWEGWCSNEVFGPYGVGVWKNIRSGWKDFPRFVRLEVRDRSKIRFWQDVWCGFLDLEGFYPGVV
jgi:hypothetical protein